MLHFVHDSWAFLPLPPILFKIVLAVKCKRYTRWFRCWDNGYFFIFHRFRIMCWFEQGKQYGKLFLFLSVEHYLLPCHRRARYDKKKKYFKGGRWWPSHRKCWCLQIFYKHIEADTEKYGIHIFSSIKWLLNECLWKHVTAPVVFCMCIVLFIFSHLNIIFKY